MSGVYRCVASNSAGSDQLDVHFYITGEPTQNESHPLKYIIIHIRVFLSLSLTTSGKFFGNFK